MNLSADGMDDADAPEDRSVSRTVQLEQALEHLTLTGELKPGEQLIEIELARRFGTSRGPLREAMQTLAARGLVETIRNRGVVVRAISAREATELYDVRAAVFGLAGRLPTDRLDDLMLETTYGFVRDMESLAKVEFFDDYYRTNLAFHNFLITSTGNQLLAAEYRSFVNKLHLCRAKTLVQAGGLAVSNHEHAEMVHAVVSGDRMRAQEAFFCHVERTKVRFISTLRGEAGGAK